MENTFYKLPNFCEKIQFEVPLLARNVLLQLQLSNKALDSKLLQASSAQKVALIQVQL